MKQQEQQIFKSKRNLPSLNALKTFEAAARNLSFTKAAQELFVTQSAVSRQIKYLEEYLKEPLFKRIRQNLYLTKKAQEYYGQIALAMNTIENSTHLLFEKAIDNNIVTIDLLPSLSTYWLIPHVKYLKKKIPDLKVQVIIGNNNDINFSQMNADVAIRVSDQKFLDVENEYLIDEEMALICSPNFFDKIKKLNDIYQFNFLDNLTRPHISKDWAKSAKINLGDFKEIIGFEHFFMMIEAARQDLGFALVPSFLVKEDIAKNLLINPLKIHYKTGACYYLLYPKENKTSYKLREFIKYFRKSLSDIL